MVQLVRFKTSNSLGDAAISWGVQTDDSICAVGSLLQSCPTIIDAINDWDAIGPKLDSLTKDAQVLPSETRLLSPVPEGGKIVCIGLNYRDHAIETGKEIPTEPIVFNKMAGALCGPGDEVPLPAVSSQVDYEAELVVVIGKRAWQVDESVADEHIFGYMCGHDVSARDWQMGRPGGQWLLGKSFPNFAPVGPVLVPKQFVNDPCDLRVKMSINGETLQDSSTGQLIFNPSQLIAYISKCFVLEPGDIIFTGTPPGVGAARDPERFIQPGDVCAVSIDGLGVLQNRFVA